MKYIIFNLLFVLGVSFSSNCQGVTLSKPSEEILNQELIYCSKEKLIFSRTEGSYKKFSQFFKTLDMGTGEVIEFEPTVLKEGKFFGVVFDYFVKGDYIYELVRFVKSSFTTSCKVGVLKRRISDFEIEGEIVWLGDFWIFNALDSPDIEFHDGEKGFYVIANNPEQSFIGRYDFKLNRLWQVEAEYLREENIKLTNVTVDDADNMLLALKITAAVSKKLFLFKTPPVSSSGLMFLYIDIDGEITSISPEFEENLFVKSYSFKFFPEKSELLGVFETTKLIDEKKRIYQGIGYAYIRWNIDGEIINRHSQYIKYEQIVSDNLEKHYELSGFRKSILEDEVELPAISNRIIPLINDDGSVIISYHVFHMNRGVNNDAPYRETNNSKLIYLIGTRGKVEWVNFFPYYMNRTYNLSHLNIKDDKLYLYTREFSVNFDDEGNYEYTALTGPGGWDGIILAKRTINLKSGEVESFEPVLDEPIDSYPMKKISYHDKKLLVRYHNTRKNSIMYLVVGDEK